VQVIDTPEGVIQLATEGIRKNPRSAINYAVRAGALQDTEKYTEALADANRAIELEPRQAEHWSLRGRIRMELRLYAEALGDMEKAVKLSPASSRYWSGRGQVKYNLRNFEGALQDYEKAHRLEPGNKSIYRRLALVRREMGDYEGAIADYTSAVKADPSDSLSLTGRGISRECLGDFQGALDDYSRSVAVAPESCPYERIWIFLLQRRLGKAVDRPLVEKTASSANVWHRALGEFVLGNKGEAALFAWADAGQGKVRTDRRCEAFYYAGMMRLLKGDEPGARNMFTQCVDTGLWDFYEYTFAQVELARSGKPAGTR
jgi:tetratricopeptide (TPR) repeat protein